VRQIERAVSQAVTLPCAVRRDPLNRNFDPAVLQGRRIPRLAVGRITGEAAYCAVNA
jgi:hypothetical protein